MNNVKKLVLALTTFAAASVGAQTIYSGAADQERRDRNREEALSHYRDSNKSRTPATATMREKNADGTSSARRTAHRAADSTRRVAHEAAEGTRRIGHKTAKKARDVTARVDAKMPAKTQGSVNPDGINPVGTSTKSPTAPSNGVVK